MKRKIIGLTGAFGSGATFIADNFFKPNGFKVYSLSSILKNEFKKENGRHHNHRSELQEFGNKLRKSNSHILSEIIDKEFINNDMESNIIIDSIRNPAEIRYFREKYPEFILIGVFADYEVRWNRVKEKYSGSKDAFDIDEIRDKGSFEPHYGQKISDCFFESDLILANSKHITPPDNKGHDGNNEFKDMKLKIQQYMSALDAPTDSSPTLDETLMSAAYTSGRRSSCYKRKVGAVITDKYYRIISSGFNGVPFGLQECNSALGCCYRDQKRNELSDVICKALGVENIETHKNAVFKNIKLLELCRVLHGEESAIMNLVGRGCSLDGSKMYVTTYPCNLCANKIVQAGISEVIYFEPYPVEEAKKILLEGNVKTKPFTGVTFRAFFKFYQYEP